MRPLIPVGRSCLCIYCFVFLCLAKNGALAAERLPLNQWVPLQAGGDAGYTYSQPMYVPLRKQILHWGAVRIGDPRPDLRNDVRAFDWENQNWASDYPRAKKLPGLLQPPFGKGVFYRGAAEMLDVGTPTPSMIVNAVCWDAKRQQLVYSLPGLMAAYDVKTRKWRDMKAMTELDGQKISGGPPVYGAGTCYDPVNDEILMFPHWGGENADLRDVTGQMSAHLGTLRYSFADNRWRRAGDSFVPEEIRAARQEVTDFARKLSGAADQLWQLRRSENKLPGELIDQLGKLASQAENNAKLASAAVDLHRAMDAAKGGKTAAALAAANSALAAVDRVLLVYRSVEPSPRCATPLVYHPRQKLIVMFGGHDGLVRADLKDCGMNPEPGGLNDTWVYDVAKKRWARVNTRTRPPETRLPKLVYDPASELMLLVTRTHRYTKLEDRRVMLWGLDLSEWRENGRADWSKLYEQSWPYPVHHEWFDVCLDEATGNLLLCENIRQDKAELQHVYAMRLDARQLRRSAAPKWTPLPPVKPQLIPPDDPKWVAKLKRLPANRWIHAKESRDANDRGWGTAACDPVRGHVYYFGGGHSTYQVNDVAIYAVGANEWAFAAGDHNDWVPPVRWGGVAMGLRGGPHAHHQRNEYVALDGRLYERHGCASERWSKKDGGVKPGPRYAWFYDVDRGGVWRQQKIGKVELGDGVPAPYGVPHVVDPQGFVLGFGGALEPYDGRTTPEEASFSRYDVYRNTLTVKKISGERPGFVYECRPFCYLAGRDQIFFYEFVDKSDKVQRQRTWVFDVEKNTFTQLAAANQPPGEPRTVQYLAGQDAVYAVIGERDNLQEWIYDLSKNAWRKLETTRDGPMSFASPYAQTVFVPQYGVLVNLGHASNGTAIMRPQP